MTPVHLFAATTSDWIIATGMLVGSVVLAFAMRWPVSRLTSRLGAKDYVSTIILRALTTVLLLIAVILAIRQLGVEVGPIVGAVGIGSIFVAFSLQHVFGNMVGSILLHARRPIRRGDQIHSNDHSGTVIDITGRAVVILTFDGEMVYLPNLKVLDEPIRNQTSEEFRRTVLPFQVSYDTDLRHAQRVLAKALRNLEVLEGAPPPDVILTGFADSGVDLAARFWHPSEELTARWAISEVIILIRETLADEGIEIPFPQRVLHMATPPDRNGQVVDHDRREESID